MHSQKSIWIYLHQRVKQTQPKTIQEYFMWSTRAFLKKNDEFAIHTKFAK